MWRSIVCMLLVGIATTGLAQTQIGEYSSPKSDDGDFLAVGGGIGSPAGVTLIGGYYVAPIAFRVSGGYWHEGWNGIQGDFGVTLTRSSSLNMGISLVVGKFSVDPVDDRGEKQLFSQHYVGLAYDMYLSGFFLQAGLGTGNGDYPNPQALLQLGYLFEMH
jgi:hypothetical protein